MTWTAKNNGLSGSALNVNDIFIDPATKSLPNENHLLYIATNAGIFRSPNGGDSWAQLTLPDPSNAEFGDSPAATVDELTFHWITYSPTDASVIFTLASKSSVSRIWLYRSDDAGSSWSSRGVTTV